MEINDDWEPKPFSRDDLKTSVIEKDIEKHKSKVEEFKNDLIIEAAFVEVHFPEMQHGQTKKLDNAEKKLLLDGFAERQLENRGEDEYIQEIDSQVKNYCSAQKFALGVDKALTIEIVKEIHKLLIKGEGETNTSEFRNENVSTDWESTHCDYTDVEHSLETLIKCVNNEIENCKQNEQRKPYAIAAYFLFKFCVIHPFLDGNGRLGRIIASAILYWCGLQFLVVLWFPNNPKEYNVFKMRKEQEKKYNSCLKKLSSTSNQTEYYGGNLAYMFLKSHCQTLKRFVSSF